MKSVIWILTLFCIASCAGQETTGRREMAPYHAIVVFEWVESEQAENVSSSVDLASSDEDAVAVEDADDPDDVDDAATRTAAASSALPEDDANDRTWVEENRGWIEDQIIAGLEEDNVFSDFLVTDWDSMDELAQKSDADLIVVIRIGSLVEWDEADVTVDPGLAVLTGVLWFGTAIGGLWVPDQVFPTQSDIEVLWRRPREPGTAATPEPRDVTELRNEFPQRESVYASPEYKLSLWDRAKFWSSPAAYFTNLLVPATFVPFYDEKEVERSLAVDALEDVKRDLAQKLRADSLGSAGEPFVFRLANPANGTAIQEPFVDVSFSYRVEPGFQNHQDTGLSALHIDVKREGDREYHRARAYRDEEIERINAKIVRGELIAERIEGLGPGVNLVRFSAQTARGRRWITNTIALKGP